MGGPLQSFRMGTGTPERPTAKCYSGPTEPPGRGGWLEIVFNPVEVIKPQNKNPGCIQ